MYQCLMDVECWPFFKALSKNTARKKYIVRIAHNDTSVLERKMDVNVCILQSFIYTTKLAFLRTIKKKNTEPQKGGALVGTLIKNYC